MSARSMAVGWVEAHSEHDFADLPPELQKQMEATAEKFLRWANPDVLTIKIRPDIEELRRALTEGETDD